MTRNFILISNNITCLCDKMLLEEVIQRKHDKFCILMKYCKFGWFSVDNFFHEHFVIKVSYVFWNEDKISRRLIPISICLNKIFYWDLLLQGVPQKRKCDEKYILQRIFFCIFIIWNTFPCNNYYLKSWIPKIVKKVSPLMSMVECLRFKVKYLRLNV